MKKTTLVICWIFLLAGGAAGQLSLETLIVAYATPVICGLFIAFFWMGGSIASVMMVYAGVKYLMSADDPAGRKAAKDMILHAIIAIIIITIGAIIVDMVSGVTDFGCAPP